MPNYGYHLARFYGSAARAAYLAALPAILRRPIVPPANLPLDVYSYSGERSLAEQIASARSLLRHAGRPRSFTIVSDGSYSERSLALLRRLDPCIMLENAGERVPENVSPRFHRYLSTHPTGKQLALIMSLPDSGTALYIDSDVLFFAGAHQLLGLAGSSVSPAQYLVDCQLSGDDRLFRNAAEMERPVNTGVLLLRQKLDWSLSIERFDELKGEPTFFTNQTMTHLTMHVNGGEPLDSTKFVLKLDDQFTFADRSAGDALVLRHYVNPVRHKFWTSLARSRDHVT